MRASTAGGPAEYLSVPEVAALLGVDQKTIRRLIERGALPALKVGRVYRVQRCALDHLAVAPRRRLTPPTAARPRALQGRFAAKARRMGHGER